MRLDLAKTAALVGLLSAAACEKSGGAPGESAASKEPAPAASSAGAAASAPVSAASTASSEPVASAPPPASAAVSVDAGKTKDAGAAAKLEPATKRVTGDNFALDIASPGGCKAASECAVTIKLVASGDYHVNAEYPYKFVATPAPGVEFLGKGDAATFTRAAGDFVSRDEKVGTMTVRFKPSAPGPARVAGTYKFSVCSDDQCQIEQEKVELTVPVM